jgi:heme-degrading monooxygenase HmoA
MAEPVVLINAFEVHLEEAERFIAAWEKARDYLQVQPGYIDTVLHQALGPDAEFRFVNVAHWASAADFHAATRSRDFRELAEGLVGYHSHPALYHPVRT